VSRADTEGAEFSHGLIHNERDIVIRKGWRCHIDSYSAFADNGGFSQTLLQSKINEYGITHIFVSGLAFDYCVFWSGKDAVALAGLKTFVIEDASRGISQATIEEARIAMKELVIEVITSEALPATLADIKRMGHLAPILQGYHLFPYLITAVIAVLVAVIFHFAT